jgi:hypothetical protein
MSWLGVPPAPGWHWLQSRDTGQIRMAFWAPKTGWRVSDVIGRTLKYSEFTVARRYDYCAAVPPLEREQVKFA